MVYAIYHVFPENVINLNVLRRFRMLGINSIFFKINLKVSEFETAYPICNANEFFV